MMDSHARRALLTTDANPGGGTDYVVRLSGRVDAAGGAVRARITLRYVPDRRILTPDGFRRYIESLGGGEWPSLEALAVTIVEDLNNEIVARWVQVLAASPHDPATAKEDHAILIEDRQPRWNNPALIARIQGF